MTIAALAGGWPAKSSTSKPTVPVSYVVLYHRRPDHHAADRVLGRPHGRHLGAQANPADRLRHIAATGGTLHVLRTPPRG